MWGPKIARVADTKHRELRSLRDLENGSIMSWGGEGCKHLRLTTDFDG